MTSAPASARAGLSVRNMAISLSVIAVPLVLLVAFCRPVPQDAPTVDAAPVFRSAERAARFPVRVPTPLPDGWRATNSALRTAGGTIVRVSYLTRDGRYAQLLQSDRPADALIAEELGTGVRRGTESVGGVQWHRYGGRRDGESALVLLEPAVTVIVVGDAPLADLTLLAEALRTA